tara:strand:- start:982 stop:1911 length:930 start_codon:yes stop_codon:yes gene_type:complete
MVSYDSEVTYKLRDLNDWRFPGTSLAVLGFPVRHSVSPAMHNAAIADLAAKDSQFSNWRYFRFEVEPEKLPQALPQFFEKGFFGLNLTVPHKEIAFDLITSIDAAAVEIGAVNTLKRGPDGYHGYNTDGYGLFKGIEEDLPASLAGSDIAILGAGGAARATAVQALQSDCQSLCIVNRSADRLENLLSYIQPIAREKGIPIKGFNPQDTGLEFADHTLIINATSLGLNSSDPLPIPEERLPQTAALYDMIYNPRITKLMRTVSDRGGRSANGLSMLVYQGVRALEIWSDRKIDPRTMKQAANSALAKKA